MEQNLKKVRDLQDEKYHLVVDSQDIKETLQMIGYQDDWDKWGSLLVWEENGQYEEV
jgi:hypothetical protein